MKWMEVIELRTAEKSPEFVERTLRTLITEFGKADSTKDIKMYRDALLENDACIHMHWASGRVEPQGSATGLCMVHILKEYGLVSHSVWIETE
jgi:hypothetical protein